MSNSPVSRGLFAGLPLSVRLALGFGLPIVMMLAVAGVSLSALQAAGQIAPSTMGWLVGAVVVGVLVSGVMAFSVMRSIKSPIDEAVDVAERIADGDLTAEVDVRGDDELARLQRAVATMQDRLRSMVGSLRETTDSISTASTQIAAGNTDLSHRTEQTAGSLQQTASSMQQITSTVRDTAVSARTAQELVNTAAEAAQRGGEAVTQVVQNMEEISTSSRKIAEIIGVIDGIAFQTNILALNAAVEAARAGEQGRGFAVVAGEVRTLAQRAASAAKEIKTLINTSVEKVESGGKLVRDAGTTMDAIVGSVQKVTDIIGQISSSTGEQSQGLESVNASVTQLDQMTQQNAALVNQSASAAESLRTQAERLQKVVGAFRLLQQTQQAAWTAHSAIEGARTRARVAVTPPAKPVAGPFGGGFEDRRGKARPVDDEKAPRNWGRRATDNNDWESF